MEYNVNYYLVLKLGTNAWVRANKNNQNLRNAAVARSVYFRYLSVFDDYMWQDVAF